MLLGWIAGQMIYTDPAVKAYLPDAKAWEYAPRRPARCWCWLIGKLVAGAGEPSAVDPRPDAQPPADLQQNVVGS